MTSLSRRDGKRRIAMILSGGGARGAYEVGVLWYIFDDLTRILGGAAAHRHPVRHERRRHQRVLPRRAPRRSRPRACAGWWTCGASSSSRGCSASGCGKSSRCRACCSAAATGTVSSTCVPWRSSCSARSAGARCRAVPPPRHASGAHRLVHGGLDGAHGRLHADLAGPDGARGGAPAHALPRRPHRARTTRSPARRSRSSSRPYASTASSTSTAASARTRPSRPRCASARRTSSPSAARARSADASCAKPATSETTRAPGRGVPPRKGAQRVPPRPRRRRHRAPHADQQRARRRDARVRRRLRGGADRRGHASAARSSTAT